MDGPKKQSVPKYRKWVMTIQNPDPSELFPEWMMTRIDDVKYIVWAYEMGSEEIGEDNPACDETGIPQGGNLHYQVYFETKKQHSVGGIRKQIGPHWLEQALMPISAENYACKADKTLVDGPWTWPEGAKQGQGTRNDLNEVFKKIKTGGESYESLLKKGENLMTLARFPKFIRQIEMVTEAPDTKEEWPLVFEGNSMAAPDPAIKQRHWWISGPPDWGKTYKMEQALGDRPVFYTKGSNKNKMESYAGQNLLVFDDSVMTFEELAMYTDTHKYGLAISQRNVDGWLKRSSVRNVIVISNKSIDEIGFKNTAGVKARFIEIKVGVAIKTVNDVLVPYYPSH